MSTTDRSTTRPGAILLALAVTSIMITGMGRYRPACEPEADKALEVAWVSQQNEKWCWAATTEMIVEHMTTTQINQCALAQAVLPGTVAAQQPIDCCQRLQPNALQCIMGDANVCNRTGTPDLRPYGITWEVSDRPLEWENLKRQISCHGAPMVWKYRSPSGSAASHMVVIIGYGSYQDTDGRWHAAVVVNDPGDVICGTDKDTILEKMRPYGDMYAGRDHRETWQYLTLNAATANQ